MDHFRNQIRIFFDDMLVSRGKEYIDADHRILILNQPITTRFVWRLKVFALTTILIASILFDGLINAFIPINIATVAVFVFIACVGAVSAMLSAYVEKHIGYWKLSKKEARTYGRKEQTREWRFFAVNHT